MADNTIAKQEDLARMRAKSDGTNNELAKGQEALLSIIRDTLEQAKAQVTRQVNNTLLAAYWQVGRHIVEYEQNGNARADYGTGMLKKLSEKLVAEFGNGFNLTNLKLIRLLYLRFPKSDALRHQLNWTHYRELLKVKDDAAMNFYLDECVACNWSTRQLQRQIHTLYYERLLASQDKATVIAEANTPKPEETFNPKEIIRDPYILEFLGIEQGEHFLESDLEQMYVNYYTRELMNPGDNPPIGIVLCAEKNDTIVRYTLPEGQSQIFASQYITYMPSEDELRNLLYQSK